MLSHLADPLPPAPSTPTLTLPNWAGFQREKEAMAASVEALLQRVARPYERPDWCAVQARGENEALSRRMLVNAGAWRVFWPYYVTVKRGSVQGANGQRERPRLHSLRSWLPGRWMFVPQDQLGCALRLRDELGLVAIPLLAGRPIEIPDECVWQLRSFAEPDGLITKAKSPPPKMVEIKGENLRAAIRELNLGLRGAVLARGMMGSVAAA